MHETENSLIALPHNYGGPQVAHSSNPGVGSVRRSSFPRARHHSRAALPARSEKASKTAHSANPLTGGVCTGTWLRAWTCCWPHAGLPPPRPLALKYGPPCPSPFLAPFLAVTAPAVAPELRHLLVLLLAQGPPRGRTRSGGGTMARGAWLWRMRRLWLPSVLWPWLLAQGRRGMRPLRVGSMQVGVPRPGAGAWMACGSRTCGMQRCCRQLGRMLGGSRVRPGRLLVYRKVG